MASGEMGWPSGEYVEGQGLEVYDRMSVKDLEDYKKFKADILRAYELRPEAYKLQFRGGKKRPND